MKTVLCASALILLLAGSAAAKPGVAVTTVNLRANPDTASEILGKIPGGSRLDVGECTNGWCAVSWQGKQGFAIQTALDASGRTARRAPLRRPLPDYDDDDDYELVAPYRVAPYVIAPRPYFYGPSFGYYGWGPGWGWRGGWRRW